MIDAPSVMDLFLW